MASPIANVVLRVDGEAQALGRYTSRLTCSARYAQLLGEAVGTYAILCLTRTRKPLRPAHYAGIALIGSVDREGPGLLVNLRDPVQFVRPVPFGGAQRFEDNLEGYPIPDRSIDGRTVRFISEANYDRILQAGFCGEEGEQAGGGGFYEAVVGAQYGTPRRMIGDRIWRDRTFRRLLIAETNGVCALTGHRVVDPQGGLFVDAAHILPVSERGPDVLANGLMLMPNLHRAWDRGMIALDDELRIIVSEHFDRRALGPVVGGQQASVSPQHAAAINRSFLRWHREKFGLNFTHY